MGYGKLYSSVGKIKNGPHQSCSQSEKSAGAPNLPGVALVAYNSTEMEDL